MTVAARKIYAANKALKVKHEAVLGYASRVTIKYLQMCRTKADKEAGIEPHQDPAQRLLHWNAIVVQQLDFEVPAASLDSFAWGTAFALSVCMWLKTLKWPTGKNASDPGITILELLAIQTSQQNPAIELLPYPWPKRTIAFDLALRQLQKITNGKLLPWDLKAEVKCLTKLRSKKPQKGFVRRPVMTFAKETLNCIQKGYNKGGEFKLDHKSGK